MNAERFRETPCNRKRGCQSACFHVWLESPLVGLIRSASFTQHPQWYSDLATDIIILIYGFARFPHSPLEFQSSISAEIFVKFPDVSLGPRATLVYSRCLINNCCMSVSSPSRHSEARMMSTI